MKYLLWIIDFIFYTLILILYIKWLYNSYKNILNKKLESKTIDKIANIIVLIIIIAGSTAAVCYYIKLVIVDYWW